MTKTHLPSLFSRRAKGGQLLPIHTPPPTTKDLSPTRVPASPCHHRRSHGPGAIPSSLQRMQARPPEQPQSILPRRTTPMKSKPRSKFTSSCSACASSSNSQPRLNSLVQTKKRGSRKACPCETRTKFSFSPPEPVPPHAWTHFRPPPAGHASETPQTSPYKPRKPPAPLPPTKPTPHTPTQSTKSRPLLKKSH
jgi:hypothetical protein